MRPIDLTPEENRRGSAGGAKGGPLAYIVIGALLIALAGVAMLVSTNNEISGTKAEITEVKAETAAAEARAEKLSAYTQVGEVHTQRIATVTSLAESRFDWERVMRELALILPADVQLTTLAGTVKPEVSVNGAGAVGLRTSSQGPALEMVGCAKGQEGVAGFVTALKDIDGVTRVGMQGSKLGEEGGAGEGEGETTETASGTGGEESCQTQDYVAEFQIVAVFDAAPVPTTGIETEETAE